ncbi:MAG: hypothetical protein H6R07_820 [Proteobacteria bacterium]|nr:hypothetical protein [Pseudomonadota bacterium]
MLTTIMKTVRLRLSSEDESEIHTVEISFEEREVALLGKYVANCDRLQRAAIFAAGFPVVKNFTWTQTEGSKFNISPIDYGQVCELLHLARPFFLSKEDASFEKILEVFKGKSEGTALVRHLGYLRDSYDRGDYQPYFQISINETPLFDDATIKIWLNGAEYHQDKNKATVVAALEAALTTDVARGIFVSQLSGRIRATFMLGHLARLVASGGENGG